MARPEGMVVVSDLIPTNKNSVMSDDIFVTRCWMFLVDTYLLIHVVIEIEKVATVVAS